MAIHIGKLIKERAKIRRLSQEMIGKKINTTKQNVGNIFRRKSIDTELLLKICEALEYNFFEHYYNEEPLKSMRNEELLRLQDTVKKLNAELTLKNESINTLNYMTEVQKENINFWKEEAKKYLSQKQAAKKKK
jgi:transcriptional regulator with XRE-family HTH domain